MSKQTERERTGFMMKLATFIVDKRGLIFLLISRMLIYLNLPESGDETYAFTDVIAQTAREQYPDGRVYVVGNSTNAYECRSHARFKAASAWAEAALNFSLIRYA